MLAHRIAATVYSATGTAFAAAPEVMRRPRANAAGATTSRSVPAA